MAAAAKVKTVVLSHQVGGGRGGNNDPLTADLKKYFSGEIIVGVWLLLHARFLFT